MDETLKKTVACGLAGSVSLMAVAVHQQCAPRDLCEVRATELPIRTTERPHQSVPTPRW